MLRTALMAAALLASGPAHAESHPIGNRVEVNGMQMYYEALGEGDPLIVLHGAYMNIPSMGAIVPKLADPQGLCARVSGPWAHHRHRPAHHLSEPRR